MKADTFFLKVISLNMETHYLLRRMFRFSVFVGIIRDWLRNYRRLVDAISANKEDAS